MEENRGVDPVVEVRPGREKGIRRRRYTQAASAGCLLTPKKQALLMHLSECRLLSLPQLAALGNLSEKAARKHLRPMFDGGLVGVVAVPRSVLAEPEDLNDESLLYGSAPNIYLPSKEGLRQLYILGRIEREERDRPVPSYGPRNALFLAHELQIRDVRVFLERVRRHDGGKLVNWRYGPDAAFDLSAYAVPGVRSVRPDAWFAHRTEAGKTLVGLVEVDRGTERGDSRWKEKAAQYSGLLTSGQGELTAVTGFQSARVLVVVPSAARRDWLAGRLVEFVPNEVVRRQFWIVVRPQLLDSGSFTAPIWRRVGEGACDLPLLPAAAIIEKATP